VDALRTGPRNICEGVAAAACTEPADESGDAALPRACARNVNRKRDESLYRIEPLGERHNRAAFSCGVEALDRYLQKQAGQDVSKHVAAAFVITPDGVTIAGFYTLSAHVVSLSELPESVSKKLPRHLKVPATLLGRLAVSREFRGQGLGELLLVDALKRVLLSTREIASAVVVVDAKDERAREFYLRHDFIPLPSQRSRLFYPVQTIEKLFFERRVKALRESRGARQRRNAEGGKSARGSASLGTLGTGRMTA
jgi:GNAT superfamily N-acetyltransferase